MLTIKRIIVVIFVSYSHVLADDISKPKESLKSNEDFQDPEMIRIKLLQNVAKRLSVLGSGETPNDRLSQDIEYANIIINDENKKEINADPHVTYSDIKHKIVQIIAQDLKKEGIRIEKVSALLNETFQEKILEKKKALENLVTRFIINIKNGEMPDEKLAYDLQDFDSIMRKVSKNLKNDPNHVIDTAYEHKIIEKMVGEAPVPVDEIEIEKQSAILHKVLYDETETEKITFLQNVANRIKELPSGEIPDDEILDEIALASSIVNEETEKEKHEPQPSEHTIKELFSKNLDIEEESPASNEENVANIINEPKSSEIP